jgi:hypothetical protein
MTAASRVRTNLPIVAIETFINSIRDSGYKNLASSLAELVDNSIEAGAEHVSVSISSEPQPRIIVVDDGCGMPPSVLQIALQFGGSTRFNSRIGAGRYGMGLPCSALSQAQRVDLYSWQTPSSVWWTYLDVTQIIHGVLPSVPRAKRLGARAPVCPETRSGTVVTLSDCDRLELGQNSGLDAQVKRTLGRIFRRAIAQGVSLSVNGELVRSVDPLFLAHSSLPARAKPYGSAMEFPLRIGRSEASIVRVRFSELPVEKLSSLANSEKANHGITKGAGVSLLRAGREVDYGWFFMGAKRKENYDDWWRCEVEFEPPVDELFGLTHTKQRVNPTRTLSALLTPHIENVARTLNRRVREAFQRMASSRHLSSASRLAESRDALLEPPRLVQRSRASKANVAGHGNMTPSPVSGLQYQVLHSGLPDGSVFQSALQGKTLAMTVNTDHAFYEQLLAPMLKRRSIQPREAIEALELLLLAYCRAETSFYRKVDRQIAKHIRECWGNALTAYVG